MHIENKYFIKGIYIPGLDSEGASDDLQNELLDYIEDREQDYLRRILGPELYNAYTDETSLGTLIDTDSRWDYLFYGFTYTDLSGLTRNWRGLLMEDVLSSPIANYIFVGWMEDKSSSSALSGEVRTDSESSKNVNPTGKIVKAWNEMVNMNREALGFITEYYVDGEAMFPEYINSAYRIYLDTFSGRLNSELFEHRNSLGL